MSNHDNDPTAGYPDEPHERGIRAFYAGSDLDSNPYDDGTSEHHEWMTGWYTAEKRDKD